MITADAGYHSDANIEQLKDQNISALIADNQMRKRDERFKDQDKHKSKADPLFDKSTTGQAKSTKRFGPKEFHFKDQYTATCPAGKVMSSPGSVYTTAQGLKYQNYTAQVAACNICPLREKCLKGPLKSNGGRGRQVSRFQPKAIDSPEGRQLYSQRIGTVEPVFANLRHNKRLARLNH